MKTLDETDREVRKSGECKRRREESRKLEVIDWALEMFRPELKAYVKKEKSFKSDPRNQAKNILDEVTKNYGKTS